MENKDAERRQRAASLRRYEREIYQCTRCGFCRVWGWKGVGYVCPTYPHTPAWETEYARGRVRLARATLEGEIAITDDLLRHAYECTLCGNCAEHCPVDLPLTDIFHAWREALAEAGHIPETHRLIAGYIEQYGTPYGPPPDADPFPPHTHKETAEILFYPGCTNVRMAPEEVEAIVSIFDKLGLDYTLFDVESCCGIPLYEVGQMEGFRAVAAKTLELMRRRRARVIVTSCPSCYQAFKVLYQAEEGLHHDFEVQHISEFLLPRIKDRLNALPARVTWHDPCVLGRHLGLYEPPRDVLRQVPALELVEMASHHEASQCCGAGGGVFFTAQEVAAATVEDRVKQAEEVGAQTLVTSCPNCYVRFRQNVRKSRRRLRAASLAMLINDVLEEETAK